MKIICLTFSFFIYFCVTLDAGLIPRWQLLLGNEQNDISPMPSSMSNTANVENGTQNKNGTLPPKNPIEFELMPIRRKVPKNDSSGISQGFMPIRQNVPISHVTTIHEHLNERKETKIIAKKINVLSDGNCLFRSFAVSLYGRDDNIEHKNLRKAAARTLGQFECDPSRSAEDQQQMRNMIMVNLPNGQLDMSMYNDSIARYALIYVNKDANFVGTAECQALAIHLNRPVALINSRHTDVTVLHPNFTQTNREITNDNYEQLWELEVNPIVIWHNGDNHFKSIRLVDNTDIYGFGENSVDYGDNLF